jgi:hypothetical protein
MANSTALLFYVEWSDHQIKDIIDITHGNEQL